jgi:hypothetical protein
MADELELSDNDLADAPPASWALPASVVNHNGDPLDPELDFFAPPPEEIGEVFTAFSTLKASQKPWPLPSRLLLAAFCGSAVVAVLHFCGMTDSVVQGLLALPVAALALYFTRFSHRVSYVGRRGISRIRCKGRRPAWAAPQTFLFETATELRTSQTRMYHNGVYTGTSYSFKWTNSEGKKVHTLSGSYRGEKKPPKPQDPFHFAQAAERAWIISLFDAVREAIRTEGSVRFNIGGGNWVSVGPGLIVTHQKGGTEEWPASEIGGIDVDGGVFKIKRMDAKEGWFSSTGVFKFSYGSMANAQLFIRCLSEYILNPQRSAASQSPSGPGKPAAPLSQATESSEGILELD